MEVQNRRQFIHKISIVSGASLCIAAVSSTAVLQSCSTIDDYLITDPNDLKDHVIVVGGGITGLYAAYQLKKRKIPFRIFESSGRLGGKFLSNQNYEYGPFEFSNSDKNMLALAKELQLKTEKIDTKMWAFKNGTTDFIEQLSERIAGVLPTQQIRFNSQLLSVAAVGSKFKVIFATQKSDKTYSAQKIFIALPYQDLAKTDILNSYQIKNDFTKIEYIRVLIPLNKSKDLVKSGNKNGIDFSNRYYRGAHHITLSATAGTLPLEIESIGAWISANIFQSNKIGLNLQPEQIYKWSEKHSPDIAGALSETKNEIVLSEGFNLQFLPQYSRVENLLIHVNQHIDQFL